MPANSTAGVEGRKRRARGLPPKPYREFVLTPHRSGFWCRKIHKKLHYFGRWGRRINGKMVRLPGDGWEAAKALHDAQIDDLAAGRKPRIRSLDQLEAAANEVDGRDGVIRIKDLCNAFLTNKKHKLQVGEIGHRSFDEYKRITDILVEHFGANRPVDDLAPRDFEDLRHKMAKRWGPVRLTNAVVYTRSVFRYAYQLELLEKPIRCLESNSKVFAAPSQDVIRRHKATKPKRILTPEQCRQLLDAAPLPLRAMLYLGFNSGFGAHDCAMLPLAAVDLDNNVIDFARPKTGIDRRCPLWPESVEALRQSIAARPAPKSEEAEGLLFVTSRGRPWLSRGIANPICQAVRKLMKDVGIHQAGFGGYTPRHVFRTVADGAKDPPATDRIMGHKDDTTGGKHYRHAIDDSRLAAVTYHVRKWLFGEQ